MGRMMTPHNLACIVCVGVHLCYDRLYLYERTFDCAVLVHI